MFLSFHKLQDAIEKKELTAAYEGQEVSIRGYLLLSADDRWILSAEPNVKSCCLGAAAKAEQQIVLEGNFDQEQVNALVSVQGLFAVNAGYDPRASHSYLFILKQARLEPSQGLTIPWWTIGIGAAIILGVVLIRLKNRSKSARRGR